jgi:hypothetical protein
MGRRRRTPPPTIIARSARKNYYQTDFDGKTWNETLIHNLVRKAIGDLSHRWPTPIDIVPYEEIYQHAMGVAWQAHLDYKKERGSYSSFVLMVIKRRMITYYYTLLKKTGANREILMTDLRGLKEARELHSLLQLYVQKMRVEVPAIESLDFYAILESIPDYRIITDKVLGGYKDYELAMVYSTTAGEIRRRYSVATAEFVKKWQNYLHKTGMTDLQRRHFHHTPDEG